MVITKLVSLQMEIEQKTPKHIIQIFHEVLHHSKNCLAFGNDYYLLDSLLGNELALFSTFLRVVE